jgi:hypothetical protein
LDVRNNRLGVNRERVEEEKVMFRCERCGSSYSSAHAVGVENCPRCRLRDGAVAPLSFKVFDLPQAKARQDAPGEEDLTKNSAAPPPS